MQSRFTLYPLLVLAIVVFGSAATAQNVLLPGAPGESSRSVSASEIDTSQLPFTDADIVFMQDMIGHHAQAVEMTDLVEGRTTNPVLLALAHRIAVSQDDEMELMQSWLRARDQDVPEIHPTLPDSDQPHGHHGHESHAHEGMPGMLTSDQMAALAASSGTDFDRMFLEFMIYHHTGALIMVDELLAEDRAGQETEIFNFASHVDSDQRAEILRMRRMLEDLPPASDHHHHAPHHHETD